MYCWNKIKIKSKLNFKIQINSALKNKKDKKRKATRNGNWTLREERKAEKEYIWIWAPEGSPPSLATEKKLHFEVRGVWGQWWFGMIEHFFSCKYQKTQLQGAETVTISYNWTIQRKAGLQILFSQDVYEASSLGLGLVPRLNHLMEISWLQNSQGLHASLLVSRKRNSISCPSHLTKSPASFW